MPAQMTLARRHELQPRRSRVAWDGFETPKGERPGVRRNENPKCHRAYFAVPATIAAAPQMLGDRKPMLNKKFLESQANIEAFTRLMRVAEDWAYALVKVDDPTARVSG